MAGMCRTCLLSQSKASLATIKDRGARLPVLGQQRTPRTALECGLRGRPLQVILRHQFFLQNFRIQQQQRVTTSAGLLPVDPWAPGVNSESIASQLFALSLFPYLGFLYHLTKSKTAPRETLFGFYFLLAFVGATIPAGIYAKVHYGTSLSNVDWLHGSAESLLSVTNILLVLGLRKALREEKAKADGPAAKESAPLETKGSSND